MLDFSIIVPTYNRGDLLLKTLGTLDRLDYSSFEVIIVDDGSTDGTESLVSSFLGDKFRYFKKENEERAAARNFGVLKARGEYINFFDSDDIAYPNHLSLASKAREEFNYTEIFALSYDIQDEKGALLSKKKLKPFVRDFIEDGNDLSCNGVFMKKSTALEFPFCTDRALSASEDFELWLRLSSRFEFPCSSKISHAVVHHPNRSTLDFNPDPLILRKELMLKHALADEEVKVTFDRKKIEFAACAYIALHLAMGGEKQASIKWLIKALSKQPNQLFSRKTAGIVKRLIL